MVHSNTFNSSDWLPSSSRMCIKCTVILRLRQSCVCCSAVWPWARLKYHTFWSKLNFTIELKSQFIYHGLLVESLACGCSCCCWCFCFFSIKAVTRSSNSFEFQSVLNSSCHFSIMSFLNLSSNFATLNVVFDVFKTSFRLPTNFSLEREKNKIKIRLFATKNFFLLWIVSLNSSVCYSN